MANFNVNDSTWEGFGIGFSIAGLLLFAGIGYLIYYIWESRKNNQPIIPRSDFRFIGIIFLCGVLLFAFFYVWELFVLR